MAVDLVISQLLFNAINLDIEYSREGVEEKYDCEVRNVFEEYNDMRVAGRSLFLMEEKRWVGNRDTQNMPRV